MAVANKITAEKHTHEHTRETAFTRTQFGNATLNIAIDLFIFRSFFFRSFFYSLFFVTLLRVIEKLYCARPPPPLNTAADPLCDEWRNICRMKTHVTFDVNAFAYFDQLETVEKCWRSHLLFAKMIFQHIYGLQFSNEYCCDFGICFEKKNINSKKKTKMFGREKSRK